MEEGFVGSLLRQKSTHSEENPKQLGIGRRLRFVTKLV